MKPKEKDKIIASVKDSVRRIGLHLQSFAWGAIKLFSNNKSLCVAMGQPTKFANICRSRADIDLKSIVEKIYDEKELKV